VVPARDAGATLGACLQSVFAQADAEVEVIVVDDGSRDDTGPVAARHPVTTVVRLDTPVGAAGARNRGAALARAPLLLFLDADVVLAPEALARVHKAFDEPGVDAVFGSYDDAPAALTLVSQFKNLCHHHFHQRARRRARTFWAACGAVRRGAFAAVGGFDDRRYREPSIEDVELGHRLVAAGARIVADPELQVKHLKRWTLGSLLRADVRLRAIPWTLLILERRAWTPDLNLARDQLAAAGVALALLATAPALAWPAGQAVWLALLAGAAAINHRLFRLFARRGGWRLAAAGFLLQQVYYVYAAAGFVAGTAIFVRGRLSSGRRGRAWRL
jgi:GT2 family glycosyltransferase